MNREQAQIVVEAMLKQGSDLNAMLLRLQDSGLDERTFDSIRTSVGALMGSMLLDIMNPIFEIHPDLKPKGMD